MVISHPPPYQPDWALFADLDGTLVDFSPDPDQVKASPELNTLLARLYHASCGALVLVSGRSIASLERVVALNGIAVSGQHGVERRRVDGTLEVSHEIPSARLATLQRDLEAFCADHPGLLLEKKGVSFALHYRRAPQYEAVVEKFVHSQLVGQGEHMVVQRGKMVIELKPASANKGNAIAAYMGEEPFVGLTPVYLGDDVTDEDGFAVVNRLGGVSVKVGQGETGARYRVPDISAVFGWLMGYAEYLDNAVSHVLCGKRDA